MTLASLSIGIDDFRGLREDNVCHVDKTDLLIQLLSEEPDKVSLFTRPRRWGKTLNLSMLAEFLDIRRDSDEGRALFDGLKISARKDICDRWMHKYPVVFLSLKEMEGLDFKSALASFSSTLSFFLRRAGFLLSSSKLDAQTRQELEAIYSVSLDEELLAASLAILCTALECH